MARLYCKPHCTHALTCLYTDDIAAQVDTTKPLSTKPVKSWKQNKAPAAAASSSSAEPTAEELREINARKAAEQERINQANMQQANDLLGGFTIQRDAPKPAPSSDSNDSAKAAAFSARTVTDTISDYPLQKDEDYDAFAQKVAERLLVNKTNASSVQQSQRLLRFCKTVCKRLCDDKSMRLDEVNLLKSYLSVLHADKTKNQPRKVQNKPVAQNKLPAKVQTAVAAKQSSASRNMYQDDDADYDDYDDTYDANDDFM